MRRREGEEETKKKGRGGERISQRRQGVVEGEEREDQGDEGEKVRRRQEGQEEGQQEEKR